MAQDSASGDDEQATAALRGELDDPKKVKRKELEARLARRSELEDIAFVLSTPQGRRFYWRLLTRCGIFRSSYTGDNQTFYNEGERNIGLLLMAELNEADPDAYLKMLKESRKPQL